MKPSERSEPGRFLFKTEPSAYSFAELERERRAVWDGVANPLALRHLATIRQGDLVLVYHTGAERACRGLARAGSDPYPDPKAKDPKLLVVDLTPVRALARPVSLAEIKADPRFRDFALVRMGRLSVMPVPEDLWRALLVLAGEKA
jgi:predicted RNA-binding protein with PUA-like domain